MSKRLAGRVGYPAAPDNFKVTLHPERLDEPVRWKKPRRVFVCSMGDLFHEDVPTYFRNQCFITMMIAAPQHTYIVLTKRPEEMAGYVSSWHPSYLPMKNIWFGTSVENQAAADERIPWLLKTPAAVRFLSCEPLLGPVDLGDIDIGNGWTADALTGWHVKEGWGDYQAGCAKIDWVITGGESGPGARPMNPDWVRSLRDQCQAAGVAFFHKQNGEYVWGNAGINQSSDWDGLHPIRVGKHAAGSMLDGREWKEYPGGAK